MQIASTTCARHGMAGVVRPIAGCVSKQSEIDNFNPLLFSEMMLMGFHEEMDEKCGDSIVHCCMYNFANGKCFWSDWGEPVVHEEWDGQVALARPEGENGIVVLGLLLDLDKGTLEVYKNGCRLGVMKDGLSGEYCWVVTRASLNKEISIRRAEFPANL